MSNPIIKLVSRTQIAGFVGLLAIVPPMSTALHADDITDLRNQITVLQQRLEAIEKKQSEQYLQPSPAIKTSVNRQGLIVKDEGNFSIRIQPRIQVDGRWFVDEDTGSNEILLRRVRPIFRGNAGPLNWRFMPELAGTVRILDAWGDLSLGDSHNLRIGKIKQVVGYERLQSFSKGLFMERSLPSVLTPIRDLGVELRGETAQHKVQWTVGLYDGVLDDTDLSANTNLNGNDFDFGARIAVSPWLESASKNLKDLTFGIAATMGDEHSTIDDSDRDRRIRYRTSGRNTFFRYNTGVEVDGTRLRINPFMSWYNGPFGVLTEGVKTSYELNWNGVSDTIDTIAWSLQSSWVITGENASYGGIRPKNPIGINHGKGALEIGIRYHQLEVEDAAFSALSGSAFARNDATQTAQGYGAAINWYLTDNLLLALNYEMTDFSGLGAERPSEKAILSRFQIDF